jgi:hypothetical protein
VLPWPLIDPLAELSKILYCFLPGKDTRSSSTFSACPTSSQFMPCCNGISIHFTPRTQEEEKRDVQTSKQRGDRGRGELGIYKG